MYDLTLQFFTAECDTINKMHKYSTRPFTWLLHFLIVSMSIYIKARCASISSTERVCKPQSFNINLQTLSELKFLHIIPLHFLQYQNICSSIGILLQILIDTCTAKFLIKILVMLMLNF